MPTCDAGERNRQALYRLKNDWANGTINYAELRRILEQGCQDHEHGDRAA